MIAILQVLDYARYVATGGVQLLWLILCDKPPAMTAARKVNQDVLGEWSANRKRAWSPRSRPRSRESVPAQNFHSN